MPWFDFTLGSVYAPDSETARRIASEYGLWDKRLDGTWGIDATTAHIQLCADQRLAFKYLARKTIEEMK